ncbi:lantibiotic dehydratase [Solwaraspora sp. WMMB335]|uniref:lantibiotic dehydratase n=1 Tax=Solwaraspora sp. WMMB335 TaxID=3404118 RepID=UPI003B958158
MVHELQFRAARFGIARLSLLPAETVDSHMPEDLEDTEQLCEFLRVVAADPVAREAIAVSSLSLDDTLEDVATGRPLKPAQLRRAAAVAARYLNRMRRRATPFGLMAGVASLRFGDRATVAIGAAHRKHVRPDMGWLTEVVRGLHRDPEVLAELRVVANDLCAERDDRLVVPRLLGAEGLHPQDKAEDEVVCTAPVRRAMTGAQAPICYVDLVRQVSADFPGMTENAVQAVLANLVERRFLLSDLQPPVTSGDPLRHVLEVLARLPTHPAREALTDIERKLDQYGTTPVGEGRQVLRDAATAMRQIHVNDRPLQVDLAVDAQLVLPVQVADELERAATFAWRSAPPQESALASYREEFIARYGLRGLVPIKELLDPHTGLGAPAGYMIPPSHRAPARPNVALGDRDVLMCGIAQRATGLHEREVYIDEELAERLTWRDADQPAAYVEPCAGLFADSPERLRAGEFRLLLSSMNYTRPGAMFGRFLRLLPDLHDALAAHLEELAHGWPGAHPIQLVGATISARSLNVVQVPQAVRYVLSAGLFADPTDPYTSQPHDLAVGARPDRMFVVSLSAGREVVPLVLHANQIGPDTPNIVRFLFQIGALRTPKWPLWDWGPAADRLPFLPRIRYGRTVLSSARWLPCPQLRDPALTVKDWQNAVHRWRDDWRVPDRVEVARGDLRLPLDLSSAADLLLLRAELQGSERSTVIREEPLGGEYGTGWAAGHTAEVAVPLRPVLSRSIPPVKLPPRVEAAIDGTTNRPVHRPGGEWLYLRIGATADRHDDILVRHLPALLEHADRVADRWHFIRYDAGGPHLRIRFHGIPADLHTELLPAVHDWADRLAAGGMMNDLEVGTYRPEVARYGGPDAIDVAEQAFCADSRAVIEQLALRGQGLLNLPVELLLAANYLDLVAQLHGEGWQDWLLAGYPKGRHHQVFQRHRREAVRLLGSGGSQYRLADLPGGENLTRIWERRAPSIAQYGDALRALAAKGQIAFPSSQLRSVLHMHHNRLAGISPDTEQGSYAVARGVLQAVMDRSGARPVAGSAQELSGRVAQA